MSEHAAGIVIPVQGISDEGETHLYEQFAVTSEEYDGKTTLDIRRIGQRKDTIWMIDLDDLEAAIKFLKAERRRTQP